MHKYAQKCIIIHFDKIDKNFYKNFDKNFDSFYLYNAHIS